MPIKVAAPLTLAAPVHWAARVNVPQITQEQSEWCWAACAQMVLRYYGNSSVRQCDLAAKLFGQGCCEDPGSTLCNQPAQVQDIAGIYSDWGRPSKPKYVSSSVPFSTLQAELNAQRPVEVGFIWNKGTGHQAIVCGWGVDSTGPLLLVNDPDPRWGTGAIYYTNLVLAYGAGSWQHTWISIS